MTTVVNIKLNNQVKEKLNIIKCLCQDTARKLGKGRDEGVYQKGLGKEFQGMNISYNSEETIPILYDGVGVGYERLDIGIDAWEGQPFNMILELKAVKEAIKTDHYWQLLSYMNYKKCDYGAVVNFNQGIDGQPLELAFLVRHQNNVYIYKLQTGEAILMKTTDYEAEAIEGRAIDECLNGSTKKKAPKV